MQGRCQNNKRTLCRVVAHKDTSIELAVATVQDVANIDKAEFRRRREVFDVRV